MAQNTRSAKGSATGRKKPRAYDPVKTRAAVLAQFGLVREVVEGLSEEQLAGPSGLGEWSVRELAAHLSMAVSSVVRGLGEPAPESAEVGLLDWPFTTEKYAGQVADDTRAVAAGAPVAELYGRVAADIAEVLPGAADDRVVRTRVGAMRFADFLVTRTVELVVHSDDLARATGVEVPFDRQALAACTRVLADALAVKAPGASTEVRIPPFAVVQCIEGPRHTRGTPPNVVETDPLTWIRLATGRTQWADAIEKAQVRASGERADLVGVLPILG
ncbi:maleylpyruvate isomerase family mycothiol-dependent enzyme [Streptomyces sp. NBC_00237]|uniref:maleylpyruvate isomerase family mycothiol-dependent enzyme n=1 Tax=Streptomyces sp. NBC_00237 TaxID=2975687 RepID=UPI00225B021F|nr:maleylpyruvate isomerase family mycothiol-dependent enzyme [Streptomyces sp. NBC_00237]MCX5199892.1 maleylpyruvate isomerase family mycothiol-dependent enzyme [Streptomyces sp. NBC_00237]